MQQPSIACPKCGRVSYNLNDVANRYCGACHMFHKDLRGLPSFCFDCGAYLMGGMTRHMPGCSIGALIEDSKCRD